MENKTGFFYHRDYFQYLYINSKIKTYKLRIRLPVLPRKLQSNRGFLGPIQKLAVPARALQYNCLVALISDPAGN
jgi:hypothetical protein